MTTTLPARVGRLDDLAADLDGTLVRPQDPDWDAARQAWHLAVDQRPAAVVLAESTADVVLTVRAARDLGLQVAAQSTGHNAGPLGDLRDTVLLKTARMREVQIDPVNRVARAAAGAMWMDVTPAAAEYGLAALAGSAPDVGVLGYTLGGGLSWLARSHGLAANSVVGFEVVTADGEPRRIDAAHDADLFWALRGGGGSFAIVTAIEFGLYPITEVQAGVLFWPIERSGDVLPAWQQWVRSVPEGVTSVGRILRFPPLPDLPPHLRGQSFVVVEAVSQLCPTDTDALLAPLRALGPVFDTFAPTPIPALSALHMDPPGPVPGFGDGMLLVELPDEAVTAFVTSAAAPEVPLLSVELRHLGGALTPGRAVGGGAVDGIDAGFALFAVGITPDAESARAVRDAVDRVHHAMAPWSTGGCYLNFAERAKSGAALWGAPTHHRLQAIKAAYDPANVIRSNHPV